VERTEERTGMMEKVERATLAVAAAAIAAVVVAQLYQTSHASRPSLA